MQLTKEQYEKIAPLFAGAKRERADFQPANAGRLIVYGGERMQVARLANSLRQVVYDLHSDEPLVEERGSGKSV